MNPAMILDPLRKLNADAEHQAREIEDIAKPSSGSRSALMSRNNAFSMPIGPASSRQPSLQVDSKSSKARRAAVELQKAQSGSIAPVTAEQVEKAVNEVPRRGSPQSFDLQFR